jgi:hypothetical protein
MPFTLKFFLVFICVTATDACWAVYIVRIAEKKAIQAGLWGSLISLLAAFTVVSYTEDHRLIIAIVIGAFAGTWIAVKRLIKEK